MSSWGSPYQTTATQLSNGTITTELYQNGHQRYNEHSHLRQSNAGLPSYGLNNLNTEIPARPGVYNPATQTVYAQNDGSLNGGIPNDNYAVFGGGLPGRHRNSNATMLFDMIAKSQMNSGANRNNRHSIKTFPNIATLSQSLSKSKLAPRGVSTFHFAHWSSFVS